MLLPCFARGCRPMIPKKIVYSQRVTGKSVRPLPPESTASTTSATATTAACLG